MLREKLYSLSPGLKNAVREKSNEVERELSGAVRFEEAITLPEFGRNVMIRFRPAGEIVPEIDELDRLEAGIRRLLGPDYCGNLAGLPYERWGFGRDRMPEAFMAAFRSAPAGSIRAAENIHADGLRRDAELLRRSGWLRAADLVWEVQIHENSAHLIIVLRPSPVAVVPPVEIEPGLKLAVAPADDSHAGALEIYRLAEKREVSMLRIMLEFAQRRERT